MVEGIPAFFAASRYGAALIVFMATLFAASTIITYVILCAYSAAGLRRVTLGPLERYGEVISGVFIALVGVVFWLCRCHVATLHRPSTPHAPGDTPAPSITPIPHVIADFAHSRQSSSDLSGRQNRWSGGPGQPREHHAGNPQHTQLLKSP